MRSSLPEQVADGMIENVIGTFELPMGIATNFVVNGKEYLIPMAIEEPSVVAAASYMAKIVGLNGGFHACASDPIMRAQIQLLRISEPSAAHDALLAATAQIVALANSKDKTLIALGGGCREIEVEVFKDTRIGQLTGGEARLRILSNLADRRTVKVTATITPDTLATNEFSGDRVANGIVEACAFAEVDPYRASTPLFWLLVTTGVQ